ncbi:hypothetical protein VXS06_14360 [Photobacterium toruni]|uniref:Apolipoprotein A1/A4/E domain protein n=1 Tax=Photobacterium toruni TaxID=1935446 RepID=A0ABU6LDE1_9GAMM|nr:hypothetical protein [Photobacterium toruni]
MNISKEDELVIKLSQLLDSVVLVLKSDNDVVQIPFAGEVPSLKKRTLDSIVEKFSTTFEKIDAAVKSVNNIANEARESAEVARGYSDASTTTFNDIEALSKRVEEELKTISEQSVVEVRNSLNELRLLGEKVSGELTGISDSVHTDKNNIDGLLVKITSLNDSIVNTKSQVENLKISIDSACSSTSNKINVFNEKYAELNTNCDLYISKITKLANQSIDTVNSTSQNAVKSVNDIANNAVSRVGSASSSAISNLNDVSERLQSDIDSKLLEINKSSDSAVNAVVTATDTANKSLSDTSTKIQHDLMLATNTATETVLSKAGAVDEVAKKAIKAQEAVDNHTTQVEELATIAVVGMAAEVLATQNVIVSFKESNK